MKVLEARARVLEGGRVEMSSPAVGWWRSHPAPGSLVLPGGGLGELEVLGARHRLVSPAGGLVVERAEGAHLSRVPVGFGDRLLVLDPAGSAAERLVPAAAASAGAGTQAAASLAFSAPSSGRYYGRPAPDQPAFVSAGDEIATGRVVCLLEVMKTFNRIEYGGEGMPPRARVVAVLPRDGDDLEPGQAILALEPA